MLTLLRDTWTNVLDCGSHDNVICFTADAKGGPERLWFDFAIDCQSADEQELHLELHHCNSLLGGGSATGSVYPVWQADDGDWQRLTEVERVLLDDGRFILRWTTAMPQRRGRLAACFPYQRRDLEALLSKCPGLRCDDVGVSAQGRFLPRLTNIVPETGSEIPGIFITARQHAAESPGSWVLEGILRAFAEHKDSDPLLWVLPFIDLDGVEEGRYGKNHFPLDHNRSWYGCGLCHETRLAMHEARNWASRCQPMLYLDLHAPGYMEENCYFFSGTSEPSSAQQAFLERCHAQITDFASDRFIRQSSYQVQACKDVGTPHSLSSNIYFAENFNCLSTTMECSYQAFNGVPASRDDYRQIGTGLAEAIRAHCAQLQTV